MSYVSRESSAQGGAPIFLYEFVQGEQAWRYTSAPDAYEWGGHTWQPSSLSHSDVTQSSEMAKDGISLKFPRTDEFARQFLGYAPDLVTSVTLRRGHADDGEFVVYWRGRVSGSKSSGASISIDCESIFTSLRRPGLRARYQRTCRHALYSRGCTLDPEDFAVAAPVTAAAGNVVTVPAAALQPDGWYLGGMLRAEDGSLRLITAHAGSQLTLSRPIEILITAVPAAGYGLSYGKWYGGEVVVKIYPGCDRVRATCESKFDNLDNFGGFPWIPTKNPFGGSSIV
ncbi:MAG: phage BR0599 family protein [Parazoarcus communis]